MSEVTAKAGVNSIVSRQAGVQSSVTSRGAVSTSEIEVSNQPKISSTLGGTVGPQGERGPQGPAGSITGVNVDNGLILISDDGNISGVNHDYIASGISDGIITNSQLAGSIANTKLANNAITIAGSSTSLGGSITADTIAGQISNGTVTNGQLAGSIANNKLSNSTVSYGGIGLSLGGSDATPAFNLQDATGYPTSSLAGTITNAQLAGSIANDKLSNSSLTVTAGDGLQNGGSVSLGSSTTIDVDNTVLRTTSNQTVAGNKTFVGETTINNLNVTGTFAKIDVTSLTVEDNTILLNSGEASAGVTLGKAGLEIDRGSESNYLVIFDEATDKLKIGITGSESNVISEAEFETVSQSISDGADSVELTFVNTYSSPPNVVVSLHNSNQESFLNYYVSGVTTDKATVMLSAPTTSSNYKICGFITSV